MENILNKKQIDDIKVCGRILSEAIHKAADFCRAGVDTLSLDALAEEYLLTHGCRPAFKNYYVPGAGEFPFSLCVSVNNEIVHGLPSSERILREADVVSLDLGAEYKGVFTDMAITVTVGPVSEDVKILIESTKEALNQGISQVKAGNHIGDIGYSIEKYALSKGLGIVRDYVGHGVGTGVHVQPQIPNFGTQNTGPVIEEGMALAIEPMLTLGAGETSVHPNRWTVQSADNSIAAHFEHTVVVIDGKPLVVTNS
ncbi:MAG: type I methionyl aminopeptidase [Patescibacteria group bacterium]